MSVLWINWVLIVALTLIDPTSGERWLAFLGATIITASVVYGGLRLLDSQHRT
jgi:hypothetical protein